jgi:hypothetical protein
LCKHNELRTTAAPTKPDGVQSDGNDGTYSQSHENEREKNSSYTFLCGFLLEVSLQLQSKARATEVLQQNSAATPGHEHLHASGEYVSLKRISSQHGPTAAAAHTFAHEVRFILYLELSKQKYKSFAIVLIEPSNLTE